MVLGDNSDFAAQNLNSFVFLRVFTGFLVSFRHIKANVRSNTMFIYVGAFWRVPAGNGYLELAAAGQTFNLLNAALAKTFDTDNRCCAVIAQGAGRNFAGAGTAAVYQNDCRQAFERMLAGSDFAFQDGAAAALANYRFTTI